MATDEEKDKLKKENETLQKFLACKLVNEICHIKKTLRKEFAEKYQWEVARLEKEADWLAKMQNFAVDDPTRCPPGHVPPASCKSCCKDCWREAARENSGGQA